MFGLTNLLAKAGLTRDSKILDLAAIAALLTWLMNVPPPTEWTYYEWLNAALAAVVGITQRYRTSGLPGENDHKRVNDPGARSFLLPFLLAGSVLASSCAGFMLPPNVPGTTPPAVSLSPEQVNQKAVEFAAVGTAVLGLAQDALEFSHVVIPPSTLRLEINDAASALGRTLKDIAIRAKSIVDEPTLRTVYGEVLGAADAFLAALGKSTHPQLSEYSTAIRDKLQLVRAFLTGGAQ